MKSEKPKMEDPEIQEILGRLEDIEKALGNIVDSCLSISRDLKIIVSTLNKERLSWLPYAFPLFTPLSAYKRSR